MEWVWPGIHWYQGFHAALAWQHDFGKFGLSITKMALTYSKGTESYYFLKREYVDEGRKFFEQIKNKPQILSSAIKKIDSSAEKIFSLESKWEGTDFLKSYTNNSVVKVFNTYHWGGYLIYTYPNAKVFVDGRMPAWINEDGESPYKVFIETMILTALIMLVGYLVSS